MSEGRIMVDTLRDCYRLILIRDTIFEITCTLVDYFDSVVIARLVSEPSCDVISVSILECHWIQAIIASSLNIFVIIIYCQMQVVDWVVKTCSSSARIWTIVQYPLLQSSLFPGSSWKRWRPSSGTTISSLGTPRKVCVPRPCDTVH